MRSRKKKNLEERLHNSDALLVFVEDREFYAKTENNRCNYLDLGAIFGNTNPVHLEIGCGKGGFVTELARRNRDINYLAVEITKNVIVSALEATIAEQLTNIRYLNCNAHNLIYVLSKASIDRIYLNFSCPYPKKTYANNRLTHPKFLEVYRQIMTPFAEIHQKTDSEMLFEYSVQQFTDNGFTLQNITRDLHNSDYKDNIVTEYESYFLALGKPIYRLEAYIIK